MATTTNHDKNPTVAQCVERFIAHRRRTHKDVQNDISVLRGAERTTGRRAAGPALARSQYGRVRCSQVKDWELSDWFEDRHESLSHNARRRGMATVRAFIEYCTANGWMDKRMIRHFPALPKVGSYDRAWLHPEQVVALLPLVRKYFDGYLQFAFFTLLCTGVRPSELVGLRASSLDARTHTLTVVGKGRGDGKTRTIPVDDDFIDLWRAHIAAYGIRPSGWMFFHRHREFVGGQTGETYWVYDLSRHATPSPIRRMLSHHEGSHGRTAPSLWDLAQAELPSELAPHFQITPRVMRRTFACLALIDHALSPSSGWDLRTLQRALGHESLSVTEIYLSDVEDYLMLKRGRFNAIDAARRAAERKAS